MNQRTLLAAALLTACGAPADPEVVGTSLHGPLTRQQVAATLQALPEVERVVPEGASAQRWMRQLVERAAAQEILRARSRQVPAATDSSEPGALEWAVRWNVMAAREQATLRQLALAHPPSEAEIAAERTRLEQQEPEPRWNYRHIYLRLDGARSEVAKAEVRQQAATLRQRAANGEDFAALVQQFSVSADAAEGGLVQNQRPSLLDPIARRALARLGEGEISPVIESRTGLHILKMERRLQPTPRRLEHAELAQRRAAQASLQGARQALLDQLRAENEAENRLHTEAFPWRVGAETISEAEHAWLAAQGLDARDALVDRLLLAQQSELAEEEAALLRQRTEAQAEGEAMAAVLAEHRAAVLAALPLSELRPVYEAQPSAFAAPETAHLGLLFVPQGGDPFATQLRLEQLVENLRAGASFAEAARELSTGPAASQGGDLGELPPREWARLGPEIYKAVNALEAGEISQPIFCTGRVFSTDPALLRGGFAVLQVRQKTPSRERTFEQALDDVRAAYAARHPQAISDAVQYHLLEQAKFRIVRLPEANELLADLELAS